jgi:hypothetical protein
MIDRICLSSTPLTMTRSIFALKYRPFIDDSFSAKLLGYSLCKYFGYVNAASPSSKNHVAVRFPILAGFFATHLFTPIRPIHTIHFRSPINENPSSITTAEACLRETKAELIDTNHQKQAVVVVDEKIYQNCVKV